MKVGLKLNPGQKGTKRLAAKYGDRLLCVRYRYDEVTNRRYTTVELIESSEPWFPANRKVFVKIRYDEVPLRNKVKESGGKWNKIMRRWELPYRVAIDLGLEKRIEN
ncbi:MAG: hypothetical protein JW863_13045 [Chitinispirillaceae bacterium]|nr:hypothetical protein [Chitinispirillaceae bacterium]